MGFRTGYRRGAEEPEDRGRVGRSDGAMDDILVGGFSVVPNPSNAVTAPAAAGGSEAGLPTAPVAVPASILMEAGATEGLGMAMSSFSPPLSAATTSPGAEQEPPISVGATDTSSASSASAASATANSTTTTTASDNNASALLGAIVQAITYYVAPLYYHF
ncbi:hypothetical protein CVT25_013373 [Psilocybe cyanescens]|uniref:Uncharacterized protein n=1 Tax=Psilocybe cyanescens TaxID=93625 RepID=A0A409WSF5_PSICY|nr:hypothetical protein CVT25_013373 [Psilocybe cyanescens]